MADDVKYFTSKKHPPSGQCSPGSHSGYHKIYHTFLRIKITDAYDSGIWHVGSGGRTPWLLSALSAGGESIPEASGTMIGKYSGMCWFKEIKEAVLEIAIG